MLRGRVAAYRSRVRRGLIEAFTDEQPPRDVAASFSLGVFVTALPTLGTGLLLFVLIAYYVERVSKLALFASVLVLNPVVKWGVYAGSFWLGSLLLGPIPAAEVRQLSLSAGPDVVARLVVGNVVVAVVLAALAYPIALHLVTVYRRRNLEVAESVLDAVAD